MDKIKNRGCKIIYSIYAPQSVIAGAKKANKEKIRRVIAIPTTAGTGSEVGRAAVIKDTQDLKKKIIFHPQ